MTPNSPSNPDLEAQRLQLDRERLDLDRARVAIDNRFATKHLGVLLAALVSIAATLISAAQAWRSSIDHRTEIERATIEKEKEVLIAQLDQERRWRLDVAVFLFDRRDKLFSNDPAENATTRDLLFVTFPPEITELIFRRLEATSPPAQRPIWSQATRVAEGLRAPDLLIGNLWKLTITYGTDLDHSVRSKTGPSEVALRFTRTSSKYVVWKIVDEHPVTSADASAIWSSNDKILHIRFRFDELIPSDTRPFCKYALSSPHGALFELNFYPGNRTIDGVVKVAHPDQGSPYVCAFVDPTPN
jgi:hypothetical protein